jgi:hypothetical protein
LLVLGLAEGYGWWGLGLVEGSPKNAAYKARGEIFIGAVSALAWAAGITG